MDLRRRTLLGSALGTVVLAGCLGDDDGSDGDDEDSDDSDSGDGEDEMDGDPDDGTGEDEAADGDGDGGENEDDGDDENEDDGGDTDDGDGDEDGDSDGDAAVTDTTGEENVQIAVGPDDELVFDPEAVEIDPGTTVVWTWESDGHNVVPEETPDGADWDGESERLDEGGEHEHTFETPGTYEYVCEPHEPGMAGEIHVTDGED